MGRLTIDRLLEITTRFLPTDRQDWGRAMRAELAVVGDRGERRRFGIGVLRAVLLRPAIHLAVVLGTLATVIAWASTIDYRPLTGPLDAVVCVLAAVTWQARRTAMLGPLGDSPAASRLRAGGYLLAAGIAALCVLHRRLTTDDPGLLVVGVVIAAYVLALVVVGARSGPATTRLRLTAAGCGVVAALTWLLAAVLVPPVPASPAWALMLTAVASAAAVSMNSSTTRRALLAGLLTAAVTQALIFTAVILLAHYGPDAAIPALTPHAPPAMRVSESRIELIDPYMLVLVLGGLVATALAAVTAARPAQAAKVCGSTPSSQSWSKWARKPVRVRSSSRRSGSVSRASGSEKTRPSGCLERVPTNLWQAPHQA
jgi:hypothetical protein